MKNISGKEFARLLEQKGWQLKRVKGSHHVYIKSGNPARISVPIHGNQTLRLAC
jgi:predicted RNA binding protein YcfA (HicA-like mRNA interferase family)